MNGKKLMGFYGDLPRCEDGMNRNRIDRKLVAEKYGFTFKELIKSYLNWQHIFRIEDSNLTYKQYLDKLKEAGLTPSEVGCKRGQYQLSRYNDVGPYTNESCRFITREINRSEQKHVVRGQKNHGTTWGYLKHKCRCEACKSAMSNYRQRRKTRIINYL